MRADAALYIENSSQANLFGQATSHCLGQTSASWANPFDPEPRSQYVERPLSSRSLSLVESTCNNRAVNKRQTDPVDIVVDGQRLLLDLGFMPASPAGLAFIAGISAGLLILVRRFLSRSRLLLRSRAKDSFHLYLVDSVGGPQTVLLFSVDIVINSHPSCWS